jgi:predicted ATPase
MLRRALADAADGRGGTVFLHGEPGIGKTRLVRETADLAAERGWFTAVARAYPVESGMAYAAFADALVPLLRHFDRAALATLTRGGTELAQLFPALASPDAAPRAARDTLGTSLAELKSRLFWNCTQFLARLAAKQPLLLVIENVQWADPSSVELLPPRRTSSSR